MSFKDKVRLIWARADKAGLAGFCFFFGFLLGVWAGS